MPKRNAHGITNKVSRVAGSTALMVIWRENVPCMLMYLNTWSLVGGALWGDYKPLGLGVFQRKYITRGGLYSLFLLPLLALCFPHIDGNVISSLVAPERVSYLSHQEDSIPLEPQPKTPSLSCLLVMTFCHSKRTSGQCTQSEQYLPCKSETLSSPQNPCQKSQVWPIHL